MGQSVLPSCMETASERTTQDLFRRSTNNIALYWEIYAATSNKQYWRTESGTQMNICFVQSIHIQSTYELRYEHSHLRSILRSRIPVAVSLCLSLHLSLSLDVSPSLSCSSSVSVSVWFCLTLYFFFLSLSLFLSREWCQVTECPL